MKEKKCRAQKGNYIYRGRVAVEPMLDLSSDEVSGIGLKLSSFVRRDSGVSVRETLFQAPC